MDKTALVDNLGVICILQGLFAELPQNLSLEQIHKAVFYTLVNKNIIRSNTGLAGIQELAPYDSPRGDFQVCR